MSTPSRKRINSIQVSQLIDEIKQMSVSNASIYNKLNSYDHVIKKYKIDPLDSTALEIYQFLIEEQTLSSLPTKSRINMESFKFSRNQIQLLQEEQPQTQPKLKDVQDPQIHNEKLFSFAKNHKNDNRKVNQKDLIPKQLFDNSKDKEKSKSDIKAQQKSMFFMNQQSSNLFFEDQSKQIDQKRKSVKTISHLSNSQSDSNFFSGNYVFNSQKTKQIPKPQQVTAKSLLSLYLKRKYIYEFQNMLRIQKRKTKQNDIDKKVKYFHYMNLLKNSFKGLIENYILSKQNQMKAIKFCAVKSEYLLEEYFIEWQELTELSQETKERHEQIQGKFKQLCGYLIINNLKRNLSQMQSFREAQQQQRQQIVLKQQTLKRTLFFSSFSSKFHKNLDENTKIEQIKKLIQDNSSKKFLLRLQKFLESERLNERQLLQKCILRVKGKKLIESLKNEQNFIEVYWKSKQNSRKLIFLNYLLTAAKSSFERLGYQYSWMRDLQANIESIDKKLSNVLTQNIKHKAFKRLVLFTKTQKLNKHKIKVMFMDNFLKCLAFSSYMECKKKAETLKVQSLTQFLYANNGFKLIQFLDKRQDKMIESKSEQLKKYLHEKKCQQFFIYLESYQRSKEYYSQKLEQFQSRSAYNFLSKVWIHFKRVLKGQVINKKLVAEYLNLKNKIITERCFDALKANIFEEKLFRKKETNLNKLVKLRSFTQLCSNLKENYKYQPRLKEQAFDHLSERFLKQRKREFFVVWTNTRKQRDLKAQIQKNLVSNYKDNLLAKCFKIMKFVTVKTKEESELSQKIKENKTLRIKESYFQKMVEVLIKRKSTKHLIQVLTKCSQTLEHQLTQQTFQTIKNFEPKNQ